MPTALPQSLRGAIGDEATDDLERWFDESLQERAVPHDERPDREGGSTLGVYREVLSRLDVLERDVGDVKGELGHQRRETAELRREMNERFDQLNQRFDQQTAQFDQRLDAMNERFDRMNEQVRVQMRWTVGAIVLIGVILSALLAIAEFAA